MISQMLYFAQQNTISCITKHNPDRHYLLKNVEYLVEMYV
jgi:hypothetical protein